MKKQAFSPFALVMTAPTIAIFLALSVFPLLFTLVYSFTDFHLLSRDATQFVGISNYTDLLQNATFRQVTANTVRFMFLATFFQTLIGLALAVFVNTYEKGTKILRTTILLPTLMPPVTVALIWQIMLSNNFGIINDMLSVLGIGPVNWLLDPNTAFYAILVIDIWQYAPLAFLLIYATMQTVPAGQYEAAKIDGAGIWSQFLHITLPNITSGLLMVVLIRTIDTFRLFDKVNILTGGGPANTTATMTQFIFQQGVRSFRVGYSAAAALLMTGLVLLFSFVYVKKMLTKNR